MQTYTLDHCPTLPPAPTTTQPGDRIWALEFNRHHISAFWCVLSHSDSQNKDLVKRPTCNCSLCSSENSYSGFFSENKVYNFSCLGSSSLSKQRVKHAGPSCPHLCKGRNQSSRPSLLNTSLNYSFLPGSCAPLYKENPKARRELQRRASGKPNKGLNSPLFSSPDPCGQYQCTQS